MSDSLRTLALNTLATLIVLQACGSDSSNAGTTAGSMQGSGGGGVGGTSASAGMAGAAAAAGTNMNGTAGAMQGSGGGGGGTSGTGTGGSSAGGAGPGGSGSGGLAWLTDPEQWKPIPGTDFTLPDCTAFEARMPVSGFSPLQWQDCGVGCTSANIQVPSADSFDPTIAMVSTPDGYMPLLGVAHTLGDSTQAFQLAETIRIADGMPIAGLQVRGASDMTNCAIGNSVSGVLPVAVDHTDRNGALTLLRGRLSLSTASWQWAGPASLFSEKPISEGFDMDPEGQFWGLGSGAVFRMPSMNQNIWETMELPSTAQRGSARNGIAVWFDRIAVQGQVVERVRAWSASSGIQTLKQGFNLPFSAMDTSPTNIVGLMVQEGPYPENDDIAFWTTPITTSAAHVVPSQGPTFSLPRIKQVVYRVQTWGDYAVTHVAHIGQSPDAGNYTDAVFALVTQLSTWKTWKVKAHAGAWLQTDGCTLDDSSLYLTEYDDPLPAYRVNRILKYDLSKLDSFAEVISP